LQVLYSRPYRERLRFKDLKELASAIQAPPRSWTPEALWIAYETLEKSRVRGSVPRVLTDLVSLVRFALHQEDELIPFPDVVHRRFDVWLAGQEASGARFTAEQRVWLEAIRDHVATSLQISRDDLDQTPFIERGGLGRFYALFGDDMDRVLDELNEALAA
jgi:type I restriction enzyme R subunit